MSTDTNFTKSIRDFAPDMSIQITTGGTTAFTTPEKYIAEHDAAIEAARKEGAQLMLAKMGDVLYTMAASGAMDILGRSEEYIKGVQVGAYTQLEVAQAALDAGVVDFTVAPA